MPVVNGVRIQDLLSADSVLTAHWHMHKRAHIAMIASISVLCYVLVRSLSNIIHDFSEAPCRCLCTVQPRRYPINLSKYSHAFAAGFLIVSASCLILHATHQ